MEQLCKLFSVDELECAEVKARGTGYEPVPQHRSRENVFDDAAVYVGETEVAALKAVGELFVVETQQVQNRGLQIVDMNFFPGDTEAKFIGFAVDLAGLLLRLLP